MCITRDTDTQIPTLSSAAALASEAALASAAALADAADVTCREKKVRNSATFVFHVEKKIMSICVRLHIERAACTAYVTLKPEILYEFFDRV